MLRTPEEIALLSNALEPGIRNPTRSEHGPRQIIDDFFPGVDFRGKRVLELGPGHFEFCEEIARRGGRAEAVELDPSVIELGRRRGFRVWPGNLLHLPTLPIDGGVDGLFCKGSNNPFWFQGDEKALRTYIETMVRLVKPTGWIWVVSCPFTRTNTSAEEFARWLEVEAAIYRSLGFKEWVPPHRAVASYYAISFEHPRLAVFTRNLSPHRWSAGTLFRLPLFTLSAAARRARRQFLPGAGSSGSVAR
jgi:SAM-dependent methyltransferase